MAETESEVKKSNDYSRNHPVIIETEEEQKSSNMGSSRIHNFMSQHSLN